MSNKAIIYCDGACSGNQYSNNTGGWGAVVQYDDTVDELFGGEINTTNQRMELIACIKGLELLVEKELNKKVFTEVYSDSAYLVNCMHKGWYRRWLINNWRNSQNKPVENRDLWEQLLDLMKKYPNLEFIKVKGHSGIEMNEKADQLARKGIQVAGIK